MKMENQRESSGKRVIYTHGNKSGGYKAGRGGFSAGGSTARGGSSGFSAGGSTARGGFSASGNGRGSSSVSAARLLAAARSACAFAYAPYSGMAFGAALFGADNMIYTGCSVENAAHAASLCAERAAVAKAVSRGCTDFIAIAVAAKNGDMNVPCGVCRQVLAEFTPALVIILEDENGKPVSYKLSDLLPNTFDLKL
jgi:cytidine deaminase